MALLFEICRFFVCLVMLSAAGGKLLSFGAFVGNLTDGFRVPVSLARPLALGLVAAETLAGLALLAGGTWLRPGFYAASILMTILTGVIAMVLAQGWQVSCACFGSNKEPLSIHDILRNLLIVAAALWGLVAPAPATLADPALYLPAIGLAAVLFQIVGNLSHIMMLARYRPKDSR